MRLYWDPSTKKVIKPTRVSSYDYVLYHRSDGLVYPLYYNDYPAIRQSLAILSGSLRVIPDIVIAYKEVSGDKRNIEKDGSKIKMYVQVDAGENQNRNVHFYIDTATSFDKIIFSWNGQVTQGDNGWGATGKSFQFKVNNLTIWEDSNFKENKYNSETKKTINFNSSNTRIDFLLDAGAEAQAHIEATIWISSVDIYNSDILIGQMIPIPYKDDKELIYFV